MLFDKVLSQKFDTDIWQATKTSPDYSAEVILLSSAFGVPNNRVDTDSLTLCDHNNLCRGESAPCVIYSENYLKVHMQWYFQKEA